MEEKQVQNELTQIGTEAQSHQWIKSLFQDIG